MQKVLLFLVFVCSCQFAVLAQTFEAEDVNECPGVNVKISPDFPARVGETLTASVNVQNASKAKLDFNWAISGSRIIQGQGTPEIKTQLLPGFEGEAVTVTVTVLGLPKDCKSVASATTQIAVKIIGEPVDDYENVNVENENARLDN